MEDIALSPDEWAEHTLRAAEVAVNNRDALGGTAGPVESAESTLAASADQLAQISERIDERSPELDDQLAAQWSRFEEFQWADAGDGADTSGGVSWGSLIGGFSRFCGSVTGYFSATTSDLDQVEAIADAASATVGQLQDQVEEATDKLIEPVVLGSTTVGPPLTEIVTELNGILTRFGDVADELKNSPAVVAIKDRLQEQIGVITAFNQEMSELTGPYEKATMLERLTVVSDAIAMCKQAKAQVDATQLKNFLPTGELAQWVRARADEVITESREAIEQEVDSNARDRVDQLYERVMTSPDGIDVQDVEQGAHIVHGVRAAVTEVLATKTIEKLNDLGDKNLADALTYCGKTFGGPITRKAIEAVELAVDTVDTAIGAGLTVKEGIDALKDWASNDTPGQVALSESDLDKLAGVTVGSRTLGEAFVESMREKGSESRSALIDYLEGQITSVATSMETLRLETLQARRGTRDLIVQEQGQAIYEDAETLKAQAYEILSASLEEKVLNDPATVDST